MSPKTTRATCPAGHPEIDGGHLPSALDDRVREADLAVQLERACLHGERARGRSRLRRLVDDSHADTQPRQPQRQHQARRSCADDEDVSAFAHRWSQFKTVSSPRYLMWSRLSLGPRIALEPASLHCHLNAKPAGGLQPARFPPPKGAAMSFERAGQTANR